VRPVLLALGSPSGELGNDQTRAEEENGKIREDFETLCVAEMEA
jgi:hypothetical protein